MRFFSFVAIGLIIFAIYSCDTNRVYENFYSTGGNGWHKDSTAAFAFEINELDQRYNIYINTRNIENYPYSNLWLFVDVLAPDHTTIRDTVEYQLAFPGGQWTGKGTGGVYYNLLAYKMNVFFPIEGVYQVKIKHAMRDNELQGLIDVGIRIEKR